MQHAFTIYAICPNLDKPKTKGDSCSPPELQLIFAENALCVPQVNFLAHSKKSKRRKGSFFFVKQRVSIKGVARNFSRGVPKQKVFFTDCHELFLEV